MTRYYQMMSNGKGAVAAGTVAISDPRTAQQNARDYQVQICLTGTTAQRPKAGDPDFSIGVQAGIQYLDTSLGYVVVSDGTGAWRNPISGAAV